MRMKFNDWARTHGTPARIIQLETYHPGLIKVVQDALKRTYTRGKEDERAAQ